MIALGVAPGLAALSYAVLEHRDGVPPFLVDADVLHGARGITADEAWQILRRTRVHHLLLETIVERYVPAVVVVGPPLRIDEPASHVLAVRTVIGALARGIGVPCVEFYSHPDLLERLDTNARGLPALVRQKVPNFGQVRDKRLVLATGCALSGLGST